MNHSPTQTELLRSQGAELISGGGVRYRTWSEHERVDVLIVDQSGRTLRKVAMTPEEDGYFVSCDEAGSAGDLYRYQLNGRDHWPDPASRFQPFGVHGPSTVVDPDAFEWTDHDRMRIGPDELIIYELHIGTFTPLGTFRSAIEKLPHLVQLGVTAIEIMPVADFPGERNWGY
ncbi:MAG: malto-oligosyltrehalose trehalohydrolase, partial [Chthoniobacterales bacterium]